MFASFLISVQLHSIHFSARNVQSIYSRLLTHLRLPLVLMLVTSIILMHCSIEYDNIFILVDDKQCL